MNIQNVIFDWDGTLARTLDVWLDGYQRALELRNFTFQPKEIVAEFFHDHHKVPDKHPHIGFPEIAEETRHYVLQALQKVELYEGAIKTLSTLKDERVPTSLVSSSSRSLLTSGTQVHGLSDFFQTTVAGDDGYGHKPGTRPFEEVLDRMGANASSTLVIGDSHVDIMAGKALGCRTCLFAPVSNNLFHNFDYLRSMNADHEIEHLPDLLECI
ncbi:haloacid dehalogenase superfamily, subfamily IA, variant 3 with third motif having DD or ED/haloacid dehalogenase superfamily, subfamily IA, variant 1 with third motif having Dx(3-4)D or Dx(3-4)E [Pseudovibrio ascidiaceicola]|uniref:phosphoglycolate phosphatase n=1 Tax=Pseudovibrio ascidiaceicola TaxID=285279 RepID=A0A1I3VIM3_9HYPH|nr:HAD-IA family hydrolase [Pseudovibrio ascidiaceicola]SFJ94919.1 haloacid dehalogenase superfamily, subfamily IA, variant 3 with third motif having DD or ED/haloacid dehalogenase superfamily, subfamily IA, variant 1 with third motif having Dx(3-4)D or Dx(3-4)E [Pseudovibrio ascidiaceicola]